MTNQPFMPVYSNEDGTNTSAQIMRDLNGYYDLQMRVEGALAGVTISMHERDGYDDRKVIQTLYNLIQDLGSLAAQLEARQGEETLLQDMEFDSGWLT